MRLRYFRANDLDRMRTAAPRAGAGRAWLFLGATLVAFVLLAGGLSVLDDGAVSGPLGWDAAAHAQDATTAAPPPKKTMLDNLVAAGWIGAVIVICSIIGFSLAITFAFQLRRDSLVPPDVLGQIEQCFEEENYEEAYAVCEGNPSFFSTILASGLGKIDRPYDEIENAMIETGDVEANKLHQKVGWLSVIASISPMLGLFGTVYGMIATFDVIALSNTSPKPADLAGGISLALVTTYLGLLVAIPMTVLFVVFRNKVVSTILEVGALTEELMDRFKPTK